MKRREFLTAVAASAAATAIAAPAIAQAMPEIKWRLTTSFPRSLETLHGAAEIFAKAVAEASDNKFLIQVFSAGEIVPPLSTNSTRSITSSRFPAVIPDVRWAAGSAMRSATSPVSMA
jgi:TRAP-type mannitol/chloroaromatic compound transport system substrate-binding protein